MRHDKIACAEPVTLERAAPEKAALRIAASNNGLTHTPHDNGGQRCSCLIGFVRLLIWATRNNGH
ncbi:MAG: hypothetical protein ACI9TB_001566 [Parasphingorhabdus sp.]|jgi:hypothetical protein|nr:hypothetical protein [Sphingopyxis sp. BSNA05]